MAVSLSFLIGILAELPLLSFPFVVLVVLNVLVGWYATFYLSFYYLNFYHGTVLSYLMVSGTFVAGGIVAAVVQYGSEVQNEAKAQFDCKNKADKAGKKINPV